MSGKIVGKRSSYLVGRAFNSFLLASVMTAAAAQIGSLIDGLMLSHFVNEGAMSAINISMPVTQILFSVSMLLGVGGSMLAGMAIGNHRRDEASGLFSNVMTACAALGCLAGCAGLLWLDPLVELLCPDISLHAYTAQYLGILLPGAPIYMVMVSMQMFVTLDGHPRRVTSAVGVCTLVNLGLDYLLLGVMNAGMTGAALATVASYVAALAVLLPHFLKKGTLKYSFPGKNIQLRAIASMGLPFGIATLLIAVNILGSNLVAMHYLGTEGIVTLSVCVYMMMFSMIILTGALESFQPVAAILKGSGDNRGVMLVLGRAYRFLTLSLLLFACILILFPEFISQIFGIKDAATALVMQRALPAYAANIVLQCAVYLLIPVYQLYNHRRLALIISLCQPLLPMVCYWALSASSHGNPDVNPWWGFAIGQVAVVVILLPFAMAARREADTPVLLIPAGNPDSLFDISVKQSIGEMETAIMQADSWLRSREIGASLRHRIELALEESLKNIIQHSQSSGKKASNMDVRISIGKDQVTAVIRDEGIPFNPIEQDPGSGLGLMLVRKTCDRQNYEFLFRQNLLTIEWNR